MGASVAMAALASDPDWPVDRLVLVAPGIWDFAAMPAWQRWSLAALETLVPGQVARGGQMLDITPTDNRWVLREMALDPFVLKENRVDTVAGLLRLLAAGLEAVPAVDRPVLVQYGDQEDLIPRGQIARILEELEAAPGPVTIAFYPDGYHLLLRDLARAVPIADIAAWIADPAAPLPSSVPSAPAWERDNAGTETAASN
jgi:alpha-beta hydrolase superfamily lysophospholipase